MKTQKRYHPRRTEQAQGEWWCLNLGEGGAELATSGCRVDEWHLVSVICVAFVHVGIE